MEAGPGSYVNAGCSLGSGSVLGAFVFVNRGASLGHHARLGPFVSIGPGVVLALWYLLKVRPAVAAAEGGRLGGV